MSKFRKIVKLGIYSGLGLGVLGVLSVIGAYLYIEPSLPEPSVLKETRFQVPLRVYSSDGKLMAEYGEKRRLPLTYEQIPRNMVMAVVGAEDDRFFEHPGVDYQGILRAIGLLVMTGQKSQGGSTITMQVARNFFLSREKTFLRKFSEIVLALKIEKSLSKEEIVTLYLNKIYLGNRSYGVGAAAQIYYGKPISELSLAQLAMIGGLPKAPSRYNPIVNPSRALLRRNYVLKRMYELGHVSKAEHDEAVASLVTAKLHRKGPEAEAPYAAEMVRTRMVEKYGNDAYTEGYSVVTTVDSALQDQANRSLRYNLLAYEERHGYRGAEQKIDLLELSELDDWDEVLRKVKDVPLLEPGVVIGVHEKDAFVYTGNGRIVHLCWRGIKWAAPYTDGNHTGPAPRVAADVLAEGDVIRLYDAGKGRWSLGQIPEVAGALVSLRSKDGAIISVAGGYDFYSSKFNRADQAKRQPGSNFKPFVYSAALEKGYTAATIINDAPVVFDDPGLEDTWRPENYSGKFFGPTRLRQALVKSRNLVSIRILRSIGVRYALNYVQHFGFDAKNLPHDLSLALGSASVTPLQVAQGYAVFSNGGFAVKPYIIASIRDSNDELLYEANPAIACDDKCEAKLEAERQEDAAATAAAELVDLDEANDGLATIRLLGETETVLTPEVPVTQIQKAERVLSAENVYIMTSMMQDIIQHGTGRRAKALRRNDLAGKTGTTNDQRDAWFSGFNGEIVTTAWVGFDKPHPLGDNEFGSRAALPMWITYMRQALKDSPETRLQQPAGIISVRIDPETGLLAGADTPNAMFEVFREKFAPKKIASSNQSSGSVGEGSGGDIPELF